ncbi:MAG: nitrous oxide-stimulated promoter family protein [bacterium]
MNNERPRFERERETLQAMIRICCRDLHHSGKTLCEGCQELEDYALARLDNCTFGPDKPKCADCPIHCYKPAMRDRIRMVMRHSGPKMLVKHPMLALGHVMDGVFHQPLKPTRKPT